MDKKLKQRIDFFKRIDNAFMTKDIQFLTNNELEFKDWFVDELFLEISCGDSEDFSNYLPISLVKDFRDIFKNHDGLLSWLEEILSSQKFKQEIASSFQRLTKSLKHNVINKQDYVDGLKLEIKNNLNIIL